MNGLKQLQIEFDGIYGTIDGYNSDSNIMNYLTKLKEGMDDLDYEAVVYSLDEIIKWYDKNISKIRSNNYVFYFDSHKKIDVTAYAGRTGKGNGCSVTAHYELEDLIKWGVDFVTSNILE